MMRRFLLLAGAVWLTTSSAGAYYHFIRYTNRFAPYNPIVEKFDLNILPNKTVQVFVSDLALAGVTPSESAPWVLQSVRDAARVWNSVQSSELRVGYGGLLSTGTLQTTPGIDVTFDEMDPGTLGEGGPLVRGAAITSVAGPFVPIQRSAMRINRDLTNWKVGSRHESFFLTVVHEMGHALGLQHTFTSSVMSTEVTRAVTLAKPLEADDIAGLTILYPASGFLESMGTIMGRVTYLGSGQGVHLASVVAIRPTGAAVSTLTDPDGRYRIDGIPPDQYIVYVHPIPPALRSGRNPGDLTLPVDSDGQNVAPGPLFDTVFVGGTRDPGQTSVLNVTAGVAFDGVNFSVRQRSSAGIGPVTTYSFFGSTPVRPGFMKDGGALVGQGAGLAGGNLPTPGLNVSFLGGTPVLAASGLRAYNDRDLIIDLLPTSFFGGFGPRHAIFSLPNDLYIRPFAFSIVTDRPPSIAAVTAGLEGSGTRTATIVGADFKPETRFYFDGVATSLLRFEEANRAVVTVPPGISGYRAAVTAFNPDGQNSMFLQASAPPSFAYDTGEAGSVSLSPTSLAAGSEALVEVNGINTSFVEGQTSLGFGSSDIQVRRVWVLSPTRLVANVAVAGDAPAGLVFVSVLTGMQSIAQPFAFNIEAPNPNASTVSSNVVNTNGLASIYPGAIVTMTGTNLSNGSITIAEQPVVILASAAREMRFQIPQGLPPGLALLRFNNGTSTVLIGLSIGVVPPEVRSISASATTASSLEASSPAKPGDRLILTVANLGEPGSSIAPSRISIRVARVEHFAVECIPDGDVHKVHFVLLPSVPTGTQVPMTVSIDGRVSAVFPIAIRSN